MEMGTYMFAITKHIAPQYIVQVGNKIIDIILNSKCHERLTTSIIAINEFTETKTTNTNL